MTKDLIIRGGKGKPATSYLEAISSRLVRARSGGARVEISLGLFQTVLNELIHYRRQELADSKELEEIVSEMEGYVLPVSESRQGSIDLCDLEITDLDQLGGGSSSYALLEGPEAPESEPESESEEEEEELVIAPRRRRTLEQKRRDYWLPALNFYRTLVIALLGFFVLVGLVLLGG